MNIYIYIRIYIYLSSQLLMVIFVVSAHSPGVPVAAMVRRRQRQQTEGTFRELVSGRLNVLEKLIADLHWANSICILDTW